MLEPALIDRIRNIFLFPHPKASISTATALLGWCRNQMTEGIASGEIELMTTPLGKFVQREELMTKALETWPLEVIEEALDDDAESVLPKALRTAEVRARLPRYQIDMLRYMAEQSQTSLSGVLARELEDVASANTEELAAAIPGFCAALGWPDHENGR